MLDVLLVDDEEKIRSGIRRNFPWEQMGYIISREASNGTEALKLMKEKCPDVVLADIMMPGMNGIELARHIYEGSYKTRVVFLSGYREFDYACQALTYDVYRYILKPIDREELVAVFTSLYKIITESSGGKEGGGEVKSAYERLIDDVKSYAADHLSTVTLSSAAMHVALSISHLSRLFKAQCGITFSEWLEEVKMKRAGELLQDYQKMIYEIADEVGYDSAKNFTRAFKRYYGTTPQKYRMNPADVTARNGAEHET